MRLASKGIALLAAGFAVVVAIMAWNTWRLPDAIFDLGPPRPEIVARVEAVDVGRIASRIGAAVRFPTIINDNYELDREAFLALHDWLEDTYSAAHAVLERDVVNDLSLIYRWPGRSDCPAIGFVSHLDVVPVEKATLEDWTHPPFSGIVADGFIWGRGAVDTKDNLIIIMEALESLALRGFEPECDVYLLTGHDEENGGFHGAIPSSELLNARGVRFAWLLDEGGGFSANLDGSTEPLVASITLAAQGYLTVRVIARGEAGHSSEALEDTAITRLAEALLSLRDNPFEGSLKGTAQIDVAARAAGGPLALRVMSANQWAFRPLSESIVESYGAAHFLRSTMVATVIEGGDKENSIPGTASALVNIRLHPRDTVDDALAWLKSHVNPDFISVEQHGPATPARRPAQHDGIGFSELANAIGSVMGPVRIVPSFGSGSSDASNYQALTDAAFNFEAEDDLPNGSANAHGVNERKSIDFLAEAVVIHELLIEQHGLSPATNER
ncbi:MAG: M20/M25/M40 family metallo-hydrolase [Pseudomonadota bacterium]